MAEFSFTYRAFISYAHADRKWAVWLHRALEHYRVPRRLHSAKGFKRLGRVFRDEEELAAAAELGPKIETALKSSDVLIVVCSPRSARSKWVAQEIDAFKKLGREHRVFALIVDGEPNSEALECFSPALKRREDGEAAEPLAVDVRKFGREDAALRLIAGMLEVGYDDLRQREVRKRRQELFRAQAILVTGLALTGAALIGGYFAAVNYVAASERSSSLFAREAKELNNSGQYAKATLMALSGDASAQAGTVERLLRPDGYAFASQELLRGLTHNAQLRSLDVGTLVLPSESGLDSFKSMVDSVAYSSDGKLLATGAWDGLAKVWSAHDGKLQATFQIDAPVTAVAFSPDADRLIAGSMDGTVQVWPLDGTAPESLARAAMEIRAVGFSPDGETALAITEDAVVRSWPASGGDALTVTSSPTPIRSAAFSPDGVVVLVVTEEGKALVRSTSDGTELAAFDTGSNNVNVGTFSPDGTKVILGLNNGEVQTFAATGGPGLPPIRAGSQSISSVAFVPNADTIITGHFDGEARMWAPNGLLIQTFAGHERELKSVAVSPDGSKLFTGSLDGTAKIWSTLPVVPPRIFRIGSKVLSVAYSPDGSKILTGTVDGSVQLWPAGGGDALLSFVTAHTPDAIAQRAEFEYAIAAPRVTFSFDGTKVMAGFGDGQVVIWSAVDGNLLVRITASDLVTGVAFSPDAKKLGIVSAYSSGIWSASDGAPLTRYPDSIRPMYSIAFSPDGLKVATGSGDRTAKVWLAAGGEPLAEFAQENIVSSVMFSPDGERLLTGSWYGVARVFPIAGGEAVSTLQGHRSQVNEAVFSPDGQRVLTGSDDGSAKLWSADGGSALATYGGHQEPVRAVAFAPDGKAVLTGSEDGTARVWDMPAALSATAKQRYELACAMLKNLGYTDFSEDDYLRYPILDRNAEHPCARVWQYDPRASRMPLSRGAGE